MSESNGSAAARAVPPLPPKVAKAIVGVMAGMEKLAKDEKNAHANYQFAGINAFLEAVRPRCAEAGLLILQDEDSFEIRDMPARDGKSIAWLMIRYAFTLAHESGETWDHRPVRTAMVQASMGSQAVGAAQSYAEKEFMRSLFQIAAGDAADADTHEPASLPAGRGGRNAPARTTASGKPAAKPTANGAAPLSIAPPAAPGLIPVPAPQNNDMAGVWRAWGEAYARAIDGAATVEECNAWLEANRAPLTNLAGFSQAGKKWATALHDRTDKRRAAVYQAPLEPAAEGDLARELDDAIPFS